MWKSLLIDMSHLNLTLQGFVETQTRIESSRENGKLSHKHKLRFVTAAMSLLESNSKRLMLVHSKSTLKPSSLSLRQQRALSLQTTWDNTSMLESWLTNIQSFNKAPHSHKWFHQAKRQVLILCSAVKPPRLSVPQSLTILMIDHSTSWFKLRLTQLCSMSQRKFSDSSFLMRTWIWVLPNNLWLATTVMPAQDTSGLFLRVEHLCQIQLLTKWQLDHQRMWRSLSSQLAREVKKSYSFSRLKMVTVLMSSAKVSSMKLSALSSKNSLTLETSQ